MAAVDRAKLIAFLEDRANSREANTISGLVIKSVYEGMITRVSSGEFDDTESRCDFDCDVCNYEPEVEEGPIEKCRECGREEFGHSWLDHVK